MIEPVEYIVKCQACKFEFYDNEQKEYRCTALIDSAHKEARIGSWDCPFFKKVKKKQVQFFKGDK